MANVDRSFHKGQDFVLSAIARLTGLATSLQDIRWIYLTRKSVKRVCVCVSERKREREKERE